MTFTIVQLILSDETGDSYHRMRWPAQQLSQQDPSLRVINLEANARERFEYAARADLLVLFQSADLDLLPILAERRSRGLKTLVEYNDNFYESPAWAPVAKEWGSPLLWQSYERFIQQADGLLVTGPGLAGLFSGKFPRTPVHILENHFPFELPEKPDRPRQHLKEVTLGWAGSLGHIADLLALSPILHSLLARFPNLRIALMGNESIPELLRLPTERFSFTHWGSVQAYLEFLKTLDLGLIPLLDSAYNRCRSDVKAVEMSACGALPIMLQVLPYEKFLHGSGLRGCSSFADLEERVASYLHDRSALERDFTQTYRYLRAERMAQQRSERLALYRQHLPAQAQAHSWAMEPGFHYIQGSADTESRYLSPIRTAQTLLKNKNAVGALALLRQESDHSPYNPELLLQELRCLILLRDKSFTERVREVAPRFPRDLRFQLLEIGATHNSAELEALWEQLLTRLKSEPRPSALFFSNEIVRLLLGQLRSGAALLPQAEKLLLLFPQHAQLRFGLAESYERTANYLRAAELFASLESFLDEHAPSLKFLQEMQPGYLKAWRTALEFRGAAQQNLPQKK